jgi:DNA-binding NarL/FixJ family response regulator
MNVLYPEKPAAPVAKRQYRVFLVDDHPLVRERLGELINGEADMLVCGEAADATQAMDEISRARPDIVIVDLTLKNSHGLELIKAIQAAHAQVPVLVLSMHEESLYAERVLRAGALGYISKQEATGKVLIAIRQVLSGQVYLSEGMSERIVRKLVLGHRDSAASMDRLTDRELEVFQLIGKGVSTRRIAEDLHVGIKTVESYRARIKQKLHLDDGTQLLQHATQWVHSLEVRA